MVGLGRSHSIRKGNASAAFWKFDNADISKAGEKENSSYGDFLGCSSSLDSHRPPRMDEYGEIFASSRVSRAFSIPILDLPDDDESIVSFDPGSSEFDYSQVFGGCSSRLSFAFTYEEILQRSNVENEPSDAACDPSNEEEYLSEASNTSGHDEECIISYSDIKRCDHHSSETSMKHESQVFSVISAAVPFTENGKSYLQNGVEAIVIPPPSTDTPVEFSQAIYDDDVDDDGISVHLGESHDVDDDNDIYVHVIEMEADVKENPQATHDDDDDDDDGEISIHLGETHDVDDDNDIDVHSEEADILHTDANVIEMEAHVKENAQATHGDDDDDDDDDDDGHQDSRREKEMWNMRATKFEVDRASEVDEGREREREREKDMMDIRIVGPFRRDMMDIGIVEPFRRDAVSVGRKVVSDLTELEAEPPQRRKARLERHLRTTERVRKAIAEKDMRDLLAQKEQAERIRMAEILDGDVRRWSSGKEGNLRALLSTLQYILEPESGWQAVPLTEVVTSTSVKKAYKRATLSVHPDKLQQRGARVHEKYICEKVFNLLKEAWNKFNSEES